MGRCWSRLDHFAAALLNPAGMAIVTITIITTATEGVIGTFRQTFYGGR